MRGRPHRVMECTVAMNCPPNNVPYVHTFLTHKKLSIGRCMFPNPCCTYSMGPGAHAHHQPDGLNSVWWCVQ